jgi:hypothetical protein
MQAFKDRYTQKITTQASSQRLKANEKELYEPEQHKPQEPIVLYIIQPSNGPSG